MHLSYTFRLAFSSLSHSPLRTWLTIIGIVIGVAAVVLIVAVGNGLQANVQSQLSGLGADIVSLSPGFDRAGGAFVFREGGGPGGAGGGGGNAGNLTFHDLQAIRLSPYVKLAMGTVSGRASLEFMGQNSTGSITGITPLDYFNLNQPTIASGRWLSSGGNEVVLGDSIANGHFNNPITPNLLITIEGRVFRVVGVLAPSGGFGGSDNAILMSEQQARNIISSVATDQYSSITIQVVDSSQVDAALADLTSRLDAERHVNARTQDYTLTAAAAIQSRVASVTSSLSFFLGGIAAISLLVGAIGIANTMFTAVIERTRQIGVLKALGASRAEVTRLFVIEAGLLGLAGGAIGLGLSYGLGLLLAQAGVSLLPTGPRGGGGAIALITPELATFALVFSCLIGILAGYFPARSAASLKPIEALRYQ